MLSPRWCLLILAGLLLTLVRIFGKSWLLNNWLLCEVMDIICFSDGLYDLLWADDMVNLSTLTD